MAYPSAPPPAYQPYEVNGINELITRVFELIPVENIEIKNSLENKLYFKSTCSIEIPYRNRDIVEKRKPQIGFRRYLNV